jgi:hypothetical protein
MLTGGCFCKAIRYESRGTPFHETNCHCSICRRTTGAPFVTWFSVRSSDFRITKGEPTLFNSTEKGERSFCSRCGTQLIFQHADFLDEIDVTTGSLDNPELVSPRDNTRTSTRLRWVAAEGLPEYEEARQQG